MSKTILKAKKKGKKISIHFKEPEAWELIRLSNETRQNQINRKAV